MGRMLLHACCGPCAMYPLDLLTSDGRDLDCFWYNPNIQPQFEFDRRHENLVKASFIQAYPIWKPYEKNVQLYITIIANFSIPKSVSKKKAEEMIHGYIRPTKKPDTDNIAKIICDSLNHIAYYDDSQIVEIRVAKYYSLKPEVKVIISDVKEE